MCPTCKKAYKELHEGPGECDDCFDRKVRKHQDGLRGPKTVRLPLVLKPGGVFRYYKVGLERS